MTVASSHDATANIEPLADGAWLDQLDPGLWGTDLHQSANAFRTRGFPALKPLAPGLEFDPAYYVDAHSELEGLSPLECYRHFLLEGLPDGHSASASIHMRRLGIDLAEFPACFAWQHYVRMRPHAGASRWSALADFLAGGFESSENLLFFGPDSVPFLCALGTYFSGDRDRLAILAYERARGLGPLSAPAQQHLADAYLRQELWRPALELYTNLLERAEGTLWSLRNAIKCTGRLGGCGGMLELIRGAKGRFGDHPHWLAMVFEYAVAAFAEKEREIRRLLAAQAEPHAVADLRDFALELFGQSSDLLDPPSRSPSPGGVTFLANLDDDYRAHPRVAAAAEVMERSGIAHRIVAYTDVAGFLAALPYTVTVVVFMAPALPEVLVCLALAKKAGCRLVYDLDRDLGPPLPLPLHEAYGGYLTHGDYAELCFGHALRQAAVGLCNAIVAPCAGLLDAAAGLRPQAGRRLIADWNVATAAEARPTEGAADSLVLSTSNYLSLEGRTSPSVSALLEVLHHRPQMRLLLRGPVRLSADFLAFRGRVFRIEAVETPLEGIILALFEGAGAEDELLVLRLWQESAQHGRPVVALMPEALLPGLRQDETLLRAADATTWREHLCALIDDPHAQARLGEAAKLRFAAMGATDREKDLRWLLTGQGDTL